MRAVSVAKYHPPASSSLRVVGDGAPIGHQHRALCAGGGELGVVRCHDHRLALLGTAAQLQRELGLGLAVHAPRGLVQRQHCRGIAVTGDDRKRQALALASGEIAGIALSQLSQPRPREARSSRSPR